MKRLWMYMSGIAAAGLLGLSCAHLHAQTAAVANGNWSDPATWSAGEPNDGLPAHIDGGHTVTIDSSGELANVVDVGTASGESGTLSIGGGDLTILDSDAVAEPNLPSIRIGQAAGSTGTLSISDGAVFISGTGGFALGDLMIGDNGNATMQMTGGTMHANDEIVIGTQNTSTATLDISGGDLQALGRSILVGFAGNGTLNVSGTANVRANFDLLTGFIEGSTGTINQSGGTIEAGFMFSNSFTGGAGSTVNINMTGGTFNARIAYVLGQGIGTTTMIHSGGVINVPTNNGDMVVGDGGGNTSVYNASGTAEVNLLHNFIVGAGEGANGTVNQNGGTITAGDHLFIGRDGVGAWNLSGGVANTRHVFLGDFDTSHGTMKVTGGTLNLTGDLNVGAALASNAPPSPVGTEGQALDAHGTLIVSGAGGDINVGGNLLANAGDHTRRRPDMTGQNIADLIFEIDGSGVSTIDVTGLADLTGANIDVDVLSGSWAVGTTFDLITATSISTDYLQVAEDVGAVSLAVVSGGNGQILRATLVPEPATALLVAAGALAVALGRRRV